MTKDRNDAKQKRINEIIEKEKRQKHLSYDEINEMLKK